MRLGFLLFIALFATASTAQAGGESVMTGASASTNDFDDLGPASISFARRAKLPAEPTLEITAALVREVERGARFCAQLPRTEYALDCLSDRMAFTSRLVPAIRGYRPLKTALAEASRETRTLARQNRSKKLPTGSAKLASGRTRPLVPIETASRQFVESRAIEIVATVRSRMWRAAAKSSDARKHYEALAKAFSAYNIFETPQG